MNTTINEVLDFVKDKENEIKFIRLGFCDLHGFQKNISIMAEDLPAAFEHGVSFDGHAIKGFKDVSSSDLFLFPDPSTLTVLPWRPGPGRTARFFCDIKNPDGSLFALDGRAILKRVIRKCAEMGFVCMVGAECEFYIFKTDENGAPTSDTLDQGGYLDISPLDKGEDIRREICLTLEGMNIKPETSHHEQGPGQNEIDFKFSDAVTCADHFLTFKTVVKKITGRNGLFASFMPKPIPNQPGSGMHVNISLSKNGQNIFNDAEYTKLKESFIAGILLKIPEITLFLNPLANAYERFGFFEAPKYVSWSHQNRSQLIRIPAAHGERVRIELRSPDPSLNPYLAFALIIAAGLDGIENELILPPSVDIDLYTAPDNITNQLVPLPDHFVSAINLARGSAFIKGVLGDELLSKYIAIKDIEASHYMDARDPETFYKEHYFKTI